jgi:glycosyltransferase involved in cell wall biosynthesis
MSNKLTGVTMVRNGIQYDYCFLETIRCLEAMCDEVIVVVPDCTDDTFDTVIANVNHTKTAVVTPTLKWDEVQGKEKLSVFSNFGLNLVTEGYVFYLQADEIVHENSFAWIRQAVKRGSNGYMVHRINLWNTPYEELSVPHEKMPCSAYVIRLAKAGSYCVDDAESLAVDGLDISLQDKIDIFHYGFVRQRDVMKAKVINMQQQVFAMENYDSRLDQSEIFNPFAFFTKEELKPIDKTHPKFIKEWILTRP